MSDYAHMKQAPMQDLNAASEEYPYGLRLDLSEEDMTKIGLEMPAVGDMVHVMAMAKVVSTHASDHEEGGASCRVCLQITHMKAEIEDEEEEEDVDDRTPAEKIYGKK